MRLNDKDTLRFEDVNYDEVKFRRTGDDLTLFGYHGTDSITIKGFYAKPEFKIEIFQFADCTLPLHTLYAEGLKLFGTQDDDHIIHTESKVVMDGGAGDDILTASHYDDVLIGGTGNDKLYGDLGSDTYIFRKGHGQDVIQEQHYWMRLNDKDTLRFEDVNFREVKFSRIDDDLKLFGYHGKDSVTVKGFYNASEYQVEVFRFADRTLTLQEIEREAVFEQAGYQPEPKTTDYALQPQEAAKQLRMLTDNTPYGQGNNLHEQNGNSDTLSGVTNLNATTVAQRLQETNNPSHDTLMTLEQAQILKESALTGLHHMIEAMAEFDAGSSSEISFSPQDDSKQYLQMGVSSYWGS